jgi:hypothetical protein
MALATPPSSSASLANTHTHGSCSELRVGVADTRNQRLTNLSELRSYTWTGDNQFFINATKESLSMGAGGGHYGIWLDADLNHGRSQKCTTFDNEPLAGGLEEDFVVQYVEAFGFSMQ